MGETGLTAERLLVHIGHPKTGTTSLQAVLHASHDYLVKNGVYHPITHEKRGNNSEIVPYLLGPEVISEFRLNRLRQTAASAVAEADSHWNKLLADLVRIRPKTVVLSSEMMFSPVGSDRKSHLEAALHSIATDIQTIAYLRSPGSFFLSSLQQTLKFARPPRPPKPDRLRSRLAPIAENMPGRLSLNVFERTQLAGGDLVLDFFAKYLPDVDVGGLIRPEAERNITHSPEAISLLLENSLDQRPVRKDRHLSARAIRRADQAIPGKSRPVLFPEVHQAIIDHEREDLLWLRDTFGVVFSDVDYSRISTTGGINPLARFKRVEDLCAVDPDRKAKLRDKALRETAWWRWT